VRLWLLGLFVALLAGVAPAQASDAGSGPGPATTIDAALDGLPLPDRAVGGMPRVVVVRPGDSLWAIARTALPRTADEATDARTVAALHALNRRTIGPDPDLIQPGQHLVFPSSSTLSEEP
jgi:nucleoid-associated protein YgaU